MAIEWIIYYGDDTSFTNEDGAPKDAPRGNVQCVAYADENAGRVVLAEQDYYCWDFKDKVWVPHNFGGLLQYLRQLGVQKIVLEGYWIKRERYAALHNKATSDDRLPPMSGELRDGPDVNVSPE